MVLFPVDSARDYSYDVQNVGVHQESVIPGGTIVPALYCLKSLVLRLLKKEYVYIDSMLLAPLLENRWYMYLAVINIIGLLVRICISYKLYFVN